MATGTNIRTYFNGAWHDGDLPIIRAADHGAWLGSTVFDGARYVNGLTPDLAAHCARLNRSAKALMLTPSHSTDEIVAIIREGLQAYDAQTAVYIRPMYWGLDGGYSAIVPDDGPAGFSVCLEQIAMPPADHAVSLTTTRFRRPVLEDAVIDAKAGCLYPNNARMLAEAKAKGFNNAIAADALGNVAETATSNIFIVRGGEVYTPVPNGTFLAGITRARHISNLRADGLKVHEVVLSFDDIRAADEVFLSGNMAKVTPVNRFEEQSYQLGPVTARARSLYWEWAAQEA
ncbi:MAG: branched-chain amino acid aminotransferase [Rhodobacteraceae bacterium]|nr:branched-chain amino acid aminotransferase [Paracoccaceae bacterium]